MHDYHIHSHFCRHASGRLEEYARAAVERGIEEICFTPHIPLPGYRAGFFGNRLRMDIDEFDAYEEELERTRALFPRLAILGGVEADFIDGKEEFLEGFLSSHDFDFVLMSIHFVEAWPEGAWVYNYEESGMPLQRVYDDYFDAMARGIQTGLFDCVAHMDLVKKPGHPALRTHRAQVERIIGLCLEKGMCAEINTSGTRKAIAEPYPSLDIVRLMLERGLPLVTGSDSHAPEQIGLHFPELHEELSGALSPALVRYRGRRQIASGEVTAVGA